MKDAQGVYMSVKGGNFNCLKYFLRESHTFEFFLIIAVTFSYLYFPLMWVTTAPRTYVVCLIPFICLKTRIELRVWLSGKRLQSLQFSEKISHCIQWWES